VGGAPVAPRAADRPTGWLMRCSVADFRPGDAVYLPTDHGGADEIIRSADLATVYGGQDVVDKYANDPTVMVNGPGRTKILITADRDWRAHVDLIVDSIANLGGMACVNTTAVLYEGDPVPLAEAIAQRLATIEPLPSEDERAILPTSRSTRPRLWRTTWRSKPRARPRCSAQIRWWRRWVTATPRCGPPCTCWPRRLRQAHRHAHVELPFRCVWVSPWSRDGGYRAAADSLVVTAITGDDKLIDNLLAEPTVTNVLPRAATPTLLLRARDPAATGTGFLADILMAQQGLRPGD